MFEGIGLAVFRLQLWLKWKEIFDEWRRNSDQRQHCLPNAPVGTTCPNDHWFAHCPCQPKTTLHHNRPWNGPTAFVSPRATYNSGTTLTMIMTLISMLSTFSWCSSRRCTRKASVKHLSYRITAHRSKKPPARSLWSFDWFLRSQLSYLIIAGSLKAPKAIQGNRSRLNSRHKHKIIVVFLLHFCYSLYEMKTVSLDFWQVVSDNMKDL